MGKYKIIPIFVPHKGCPHQCSFCNQKHITGQLSETTPAQAREIIELYLSTIDTKKHHAEVAFYGGSFTAIPMQEQNALLEVAHEYLASGQIQGIRLSTRPDAIDKTILDNLKHWGVTEIELGVQSMCEDVLEKNRRGHSPEDVRRAVRLIQQYGFTLGLQMMVGLIGDSLEKSLYTGREIAALKPDFVRIYPTLVFDNTPLADYYRSGQYMPLTVQQAVEICRELLHIFDENQIKVIRVGLLMNETEAKQNFLAGPYHPRFRELVNDCS